MREILFRGKRVDNGEWVEGFYVRLNGKEHRIYTGYAETDCGDYYPDWWQVDPETVGQYTGLKDTNGKRIFEGDIVRNRDCTMIVVWYYFHAAFMLVFRVDGDYFETISNSHIYLKIIGNIHDNPEILKGE